MKEQWKKTLIWLAVAAAGRDGYDIARIEKEVMPRLYGVAYFDTPLA